MEDPFAFHSIRHHLADEDNEKNIKESRTRGARLLTPKKNSHDKLSNFNWGIIHSIRTGYHLPDQSQIRRPSSMLVRGENPRNELSQSYKNRAENAIQVPARPVATPSKWHPRSSPRSRFRRPATSQESANGRKRFLNLVTNNHLLKTRPSTVNGVRNSSIGGGKRPRKNSFEHGWEEVDNEHFATLSMYAHEERKRQREYEEEYQTDVLRARPNTSSLVTRSLNSITQSINSDDDASISDADLDEDDEADASFLDADTSDNISSLTGLAKGNIRGTGENIAERAYQHIFESTLVNGGRSDEGYTSKALNQRITSHLLREEVILRNRGLSARDALAIAKCLRINNTVLYLDLMNNPIGSEACLQIARSCKDGNRIHYLNLAGTKLGSTDKKVANLLPEALLSFNSSLATLCLQNNSLGNAFIDHLQKAMKDNHSLKFLDLSRNSFDSPKALRQLANITCKSRVSQLRLAWNNFRTSSKYFLTKICNDIDTVKLAALDLSYCGLSDSIGLLLGNLLENSLTLTSLDVSHNRLCHNSAKAIASGLEVNKNITTFHVGFNKLTESGTLAIIDAIKNHKNINHLGVENTAVTGSNDGDDQIQRVYERSVKVINARNRILSIAVEFPPQYRSVKKKKKVKQSNTSTVQWTLEKSVFAPRTKDSDSKSFYDFDADANQSKFLKKAFKIDVARSKLERVVRDEIENRKVLNVLQANYVLLLEIFKYWSSRQGAGTPFGMSMTTFSYLCGKAGLVDDNTCKLADIDRIFISSNVTKNDYAGPSKLSKRNTIKYLMRYEWLEAIVRIASRKFVESGLQKNTSSAVSELIENYLKPSIEYSPSDGWRRLRLYNESNDKVIRQFLEGILSIYKKYSGKENNPGERKCVSLGEWISFLNDYRLFDKKFTEREGRAAFVYSVPFATDELHQYSKNTVVDQLTLVSFIEAIARAVDLMDPTRVTKILPNIFSETHYDYSANKVSNSMPIDNQRASKGISESMDQGNPSPNVSSAMWVSREYTSAEFSSLHLSTLIHALLTYLAAADENVHQLEDKIAAKKRNQVQASSFNDTMDLIVDIYHQKAIIDGEQNSHKHHEFRTLDAFTADFLAALERRALQLGVTEHQESHIRIFWFGIMVGWITSADFPYDKFAFSYYLDILTHICDVESILKNMKGSEDSSVRKHVALETLEACVDRLSGDVIPEENLVNDTISKLCEAAFLDEHSHIESKVVEIDSGLDILMKFWYGAIRPQL